MRFAGAGRPLNDQGVSFFDGFKGIFLVRIYFIGRIGFAFPDFIEKIKEIGAVPADGCFMLIGTTGKKRFNIFITVLFEQVVVIGYEVRPRLRENTQNSLGVEFEHPFLLIVFKLRLSEFFERVQFIDKVLLIEVELHGTLLEYIVNFSAKCRTVFVEVVELPLYEVFFQADLIEMGIGQQKGFVESDAYVFSHVQLPHIFIQHEFNGEKQQRAPHQRTIGEFPSHKRPADIQVFRTAFVENVFLCPGQPLQLAAHLVAGLIATVGEAAQGDFRFLGYQALNDVERRFFEQKIKIMNIEKIISPQPEQQQGFVVGRQIGEPSQI